MPGPRKTRGEDNLEFLRDHVAPRVNRRSRFLINPGGELSGYGLVNAVTHYSQEVEDYDRATEFEGLGGKLIDLPAHEWKEMAEAV